MYKRQGSGVRAGLTTICNVHGYLISEGEKIPDEGRLVYRGIDIYDIVNGCLNENRYGFAEVCWLLLFGQLPTKEQLDTFNEVLIEARPVSYTHLRIMIKIINAGIFIL